MKSDEQSQPIRYSVAGKSVTTRLSKPKTIVNFFFIYIYIFNTHGAGNQRT